MKLVYDEVLVLLADVMYQQNVYQTKKPFISAKKTLAEMGAPYNSAPIRPVSFP